MRISVQWLFCAGLALWLAVSGAVWASPAPAYAQGGASLRFHGNGRGQIDRVKIPIDNPARPIDVGGDFTLEFWMKADAGENGSGACEPGGDNWINGNIMFDRDVFNQGDHGDYGISLAGGRIVFGVNNGSEGNTLCGVANVADGAWHHIAVARSGQSGAQRIFVDGHPDAEADGPAGDISYRDGRTTEYPNDPFLVIGAEKHDYDRSQFPSYSGWIDEVRISKVLRYSDLFRLPSQPFAADGDTVALYHMDEADGDTLGDSSGAAGGPSDGRLSFGGDPVGPAWSSDTPFGTAQPEPTATSSEPTALPTATSSEPTAAPTAASNEPTTAPTVVSSEPTVPPTAAQPAPEAAVATAAPVATAAAAVLTDAAQSPADADGARSGTWQIWVLAILVGLVLVGLVLLARSRRAR